MPRVSEMIAMRCTSRVLFCCVFILLQCSQAIGQQAADSWDAMRIYFDQQHTDELVTDAYSIITIEELEQAFAAFAARREDAPAARRGVAEAIYIAAIDGDRLVSEHSIWRMDNASKGRAAGYANLGRVSFSPTRSRQMEPDQRQLVDQDSYLANGDLIVPSDPAYAEIVFGFTQDAQTGGPGFVVQTPVADIARMYIAAPIDNELASTTAALQRITPDQIPETDNSAGYSTYGQQAVQWWLATCSGLKSFDISVQKRTTLSSGTPDVLLNRCRLDYQLNPKNLTVDASFSLARAAADSPIRLSVGGDLKILEVRLDGVLVKWRALVAPERTLPSGGNDAPLPTVVSTLVDIGNVQKELAETVVTIRAISNYDPSQLITLPEVSVDGAYCVRGQSFVRCSKGLLLSSVQRHGQSAKLQPSESMGERSFHWMKRPPVLEVQLAKQQRDWNVQSITTFSIQPKWFSATSRLRVQTKYSKTNRLQFSIDRAWFVDSVRVLADSASRFRTNLWQSPRTQRWFVNVDWDDNREEVQFDLEIAAHDPRKARADGVSLKPSSLLRLNGSKHDDFFVIEASGQYRIDVTRSLLARQVQPVDLPAWQRDALGSIEGGAWVFAGQASGSPAVRLSAYDGSFVANIKSVARANLDGQWETFSQIDCRPISGTVTSVVCVLPATVDPSNVQWAVAAEGEEQHLMPAASNFVALGTENSRQVEVELPVPMSQPFTMHVTVPARAEKQTVNLAVLAVPSAVGGSSTVLLPAELSLRSSGPGLQVLADAACCEDAAFDLLLREKSAKQRREYVAARVDAAASHIVTATIEPQKSQQTVWSTQQTLQHRAFSGGRMQHVQRLKVQAGEVGEVKVSIPSGWQLQGVFLNGQPVVPPGLRGSELVVGVPAYQQSEIEVRYESSGSAGSLMRELVLASPTINAPVVSSQRLLRYPPTFTTLEDWATQSRGAALWERILPRSLWKVLAPSRSEDTVRAWVVAEVAEPRSSESSVDKEFNSVKFFLVSRAAIAAFMIAFALCWTGLIRCVMPDSLAYWFTLCLGLTVATLLAPIFALPIFQVTLLSSLCAFCLRLLQPVFFYGESRDPSTQPRTHGGRSAAGSAALIVLLSLDAAGQTPESPEGVSGIRTFGVLIPTNSAGDSVEVAGSYAYVPKELLELLRRTAGKSEDELQPRLQSADYQIRIRRNALTAETRASDFQLDMRVEFPDASSRLVLPFIDPQIQLLAAVIDGQSVALGGRVNQEADQIVVSPGTAGEVSIQLQFNDLATAQNQGRLSINVAVPPLPVTTLRIVSDSQYEFQIESIGSVQKSMSSTLARIGQVGRLKVDWMDTSRIGNDSPKPVELQSAAWIHASSDQAVAVSSLTISGALPASGEISVVVDAGWSPVGDQWGDARVLDRSLVALGQKVSYRLACPVRSDLQRPFQIRVLLLPRLVDRATTLPAPFLAVLGSTQPKRTFSWTADPDATWKPEGLAFWQPTDLDSNQWGELSLSNEVPASFIATADARAPVARRQAVGKPPTPLVSEETLLHIGESELEVGYSVQFNNPVLKNQFSIRIPPACDVQRVEVDGVPSGDFQVGDTDEATFLVVNATASSVTTIGVVVTARTRVGVVREMPRIAIQDIDITNSRYYVFRSAGLECEVQSSDGLQFEPFDVPASRLLQNLEATVSAVELATDYRNVNALPAKFRVRRRSDETRLKTLLKIARTNTGWQETLYCVWDNVEQPLDVVCFEIPTLLRDSIDLGPLSRRYVPTGNPDILTLCVLPPRPENSRVVIPMRFPVESSAANQTLALESIKVLGSGEVGSYIALPSEISSNGSDDPLAVRWTKVGSEVTESGLDFLLGQGPWNVYQTLGRQSQTSWLVRGQMRESGRLLSQQIEFTNVDSQRVTAIASYLIDPAGRADFSALIPHGCKIVGASVGDRLVDWEFEDSASVSTSLQVRVLLQPNYLPAHLKLLLEFERDGSGTFCPALPEILLEAATQPLHVVNCLAAYSLVEESAARDERPQRWAETIASAATSLEGLAEDEIEQWLKQWYPSSVGVDPAASVELPLPMRAAGSETVPAADFWRIVAEQLGSSVAEPAEQQDALSPSGGARVQRALIKSADEVRLVATRNSDKPTNRFGAALLLLVILALLLVLRRRVGVAYMATLIQNPWLYWLQLSAILLAILPVIWPAVIVCMLATAAAVAQWLDQWKRRRSGLQAR